MFLSRCASARTGAETEPSRGSHCLSKTSHSPISQLELTGGSLGTWGLISSNQSQGLKVAGSQLRPPPLHLPGRT